MDNKLSMDNNPTGNKISTDSNNLTASLLTANKLMVNKLMANPNTANNKLTANNKDTPNSNPKTMAVGMANAADTD